MTKNTTTFKTSQNRRSFMKVSLATGGGMLLGFNLLTGCKTDSTAIAAEIIPPLPNPSQWYDINAYLKIGDTGLVTIMSANPEIGQNIKTSMPMIVAEELDVDWKDVVVEQAALSTDFDRQVAGGSQSIRHSWPALREAGATARQMLVETAAEKWEVKPEECTVSNGVITSPTGEAFGFGELANDAGTREIPSEVKLKDPADFKIIGHSKTNVDMKGIITGKPLFGIDTKVEGMKYAVALRPPAFGQELVDFEDSNALKINGVEQVLRFGNKIAVIANSTWAAMKGKKALQANWKDVGKLEDSAYHSQLLKEYTDKLSDEPRRVDGDIEKGFAEADMIFEKYYEAPFLPHSCMEPMNFYANVTSEGAEINGPIQTPQWTQSRVGKVLGYAEEDYSKVTVGMTRMGGGFGRRLYGDFAEEAAEISQKAGVPIQLIFSREDDMLAGTYRPASAYRIKAGIKDGKMTVYHLTEAFFNGSMFGKMPSNFPAGAVANYRVDCHKLETNLTTGAWRAPYANFLAYAEQAFFDELAGELNQDAVDLRLALFAEAKNNPVGEEHNYEVDKFVGVINLAKEKSGWPNKSGGIHLGFSAYYSHNTYVAEVAEVKMVDDVPKVQKVICAVDCGIVVNPEAAINQIEGGIVDGIGHAMYGNFEFKNGQTQQQNYNNYRLIRCDEAPKVEVHFVESNNDPTGLGEPSLPPAGGALANAIAAATGKRYYQQPFIKFLDVKG